MIAYFGTDLDSAGHYFWRIENDRLTSSSLAFPNPDGTKLTDWSKYPFDPEDMPKDERGDYMPFGGVKYYRINGYTIVAISGSCKDKRGATKSVFFTDEDISYADFVIKLLNLSIVNRMIRQMPFKVEWLLDAEHMEKVAELTPTPKD